MQIIKLTPPKINLDNIKEKIVCIRGHRERIFAVYSEHKGDKLIIHNYGQGGAGWTFLFGCINESIRIFNKFDIKKPICVIGAGCYGMLTAINLKLLGYDVRIIAKAIGDIPSYKAAGFFFPRHRKSSTAQEISIFESIGIESYKTYLQIIKGEHTFIKSGPKLLPCYFGLNIDPGFKKYIELGLVEKPEEVVIDFDNGKKYLAVKYKTIFINPSEIIKELEGLIIKLNISVTQREITNFSEISEDIIFNCSGLGAKKLTCDARMIPVQGHLITLQNQPDINALQYMINFMVPGINHKGHPSNDLIYYAPKDSGILGVTFLRGQDSDSNYYEFDRLITRCQNFFGN